LLFDPKSDLEDGVSEEDIGNACNELKQTGCINYYGMQRFGTGDVPTWKTGVEVIKGNWREAIRMIIQPKSQNHSKNTQSEQQQARDAIILQYLEDEDAKKAFEELRKVERFGNTIAFKILSNLDRHGNQSFEKAFEFLPRNLKSLFVHSYQSYVWNRVASRRHQLFGSSSVVVGDLVFTGNSFSDIDPRDCKVHFLSLSLSTPLQTNRSEI